IIGTVLAAIGGVLSGPATAHAVQTGMTAQMAHDPQFAQMTLEKQKQMLGVASSFAKFGWVFVPIFLVIIGLIQSVVMLIANAMNRGEGTFKQFWAAAINIGVVTFGVSYLFVGIIAMLRGPQSYTNTAAIASSLPSAAWLVPHAGVKAMTFLSGINPFSIWGIFLIALALIVIARVSKAIAYGAGIFLMLFSSAFGAIFAK
ncbi:MAG: hypothetical protein M3Z14_01215, partial [Candidatus Eremiobacteraeota bacterium]|nr:hypothetical protein [Candidatus Eremiobacteraeota bacterium]